MNKYMKSGLYTLLTLLSIAVFGQKSIAQVSSQPDGIIFQSVALDMDGNPGKNKTIHIKSSIIQSSVNGTVVYSENFQVVASENGIFTIVIGKGNRLSGPSSISQLDWNAGPYFLNVKAAVLPSEKANPNSIKYTDLGTSQFWSVPYALNAGSVAGLNLKLSTLDTASMLSNYVRGGNLSTVATSGNYNDLTNKPTTQFSQVNSDWNASSGSAQILNKPSLSVVATSGSYSDLTNKPTIPAAYSLPAATASTLGGIKVGTNLSIDQNGVLNASGAGVPYTGATGSVNLGGYDLTVNGLTFGKGAGAIFSNSAIGVGSLYSNTTGSENTSVGYSSLSSNTTGYQNTATGWNALHANTTGYQNTAFGWNSLGSNSVGYQNTALGWYTLSSNSTGNFNNAIGTHALYSNTTGTYNNAIGTRALFYNTTGYDNNAMGGYTLYSNTTGYANNASGSNVLYNNTTGNNNNGSGSLSLFYNTTGIGNNATGSYSLYSNTTGNYNNAAGYQALYLNTTGNNNNATGGYSLYLNTTGSGNEASGYSALSTNTTGSGNTAIGYRADVTSGSLNNATAIGNGAKVSSSNTVSIGNTNTTSWALGISATDEGNALQVGSSGSNGNGAYLTNGGTWTNASSKDFKENFEEINGEELLAKVDNLSISKWKYIGTDETHIGPIAEEFKENFNLGVKNDNRHISTLDASGVALKAIQVLNKKSREAMEAKDKKIAELEERLMRIEKLLSQLNKSN